MQYIELTACNTEKKIAVADVDGFLDAITTDGEITINGTTHTFEAIVIHMYDNQGLRKALEDLLFGAFGYDTEDNSLNSTFARKYRALIALLDNVGRDYYQNIVCQEVAA